jgi:hypothetical protein
MRPFLAGFLGLVSAVGLTAAAFATLPFTYTNERFGTSATFPREIFSEQQPPPENGDGLAWKSRDGASIAIFGSYNVMEDTPKTLDASGRTLPGRRVTYSKTGRNWLVQSGFQDGQVFYERQLISPSQVIHAVLIKYPPSLKAKYDPLVGPIAGSLKGP